MPNDSPSIQFSKGFDYLARVRYSGVPSENVQIAIHSTDAFMGSVKNFLEEITEKNSTLVEVIKKQKSLIDYNGFYNSFLLDQITKEEFKRVAEDFSFSLQTCDEEEIGKKTLILLHSTGISFSASDLSYFWGCPERQIDEVMAKLKLPK